MSGWFWLTMLVVGLAFEFWALIRRREADTLSAHTRKAFFVNTKAGRAIFTVFWAGFSVWFLIHITTSSM